MLLVLSFEIELGVKPALWPRSRVAVVPVLYREKESDPKRLSVCVWALPTSCASWKTLLARIELVHYNLSLLVLNINFLIGALDHKINIIFVMYAPHRVILGSR
ncbi:LOW QUALITY PROTEIN: hypothetical protein TorRG33x02_127780 [Trema orientale]|uniref:Uncharacterized protein n=1 Tax=Trema orientale TaxID=63057 RepID=A0A2P5F141_TREOI|nr:LOW QUALITY PROTEIN: hypothetical protein TorRG33x02_127780 [Trema orientale]